MLLDLGVCVVGIWVTWNNGVVAIDDRAVTVIVKQGLNWPWLLTGFV